MDRSVFLDTSYVVALVARSDTFHSRAVALAEQIAAAGTRLITTRGVLLEVGNTLSSIRLRSIAGQLLWNYEADPTTEIASLTDDYYAKSLILYRDRTDKEWGLVDCFSFVVMRERGIAQALTSDEHFEQAGFEALLRG